MSNDSVKELQSLKNEFMKQHYELTYIVSIKYLEEELNKVIANVTTMVKELEGEITLEDTLGKQKLAYPIENIHQGTYMILEFDMPQDNVLKLDTQLKLSNEVLRHLVIKKRIKTEEELAMEEKAQERLRKEKEEELQQLEEESKTEVKKTSKPVAEPKKEKKEEETKEKVEEVKVEEVEVKEDDKKEKKDDNKSSLEDLDKKLDEILTDDIL